jgi:hypothetical protein
MARTLIPLGYLIENQDGSVRLFDWKSSWERKALAS